MERISRRQEVKRAGKKRKKVEEKENKVTAKEEVKTSTTDPKQRRSLS